LDLVEVVDGTLGRTVSAASLRRTGDDHAVVWGDADALTRVVANLVDNAALHARAEVTVDVHAAPGDGVTLTVADDGPGIPAAARNRVFERFTRLDEARSRDAGGTGLGLPIVRELVRAHGGEVVLEDNAPGVRAVVRLPASTREADSTGRDEHRRPQDGG
jgi:signal transduction histidine kinase